MANAGKQDRLFPTVMLGIGALIMLGGALVFLFGQDYYTKPTSLRSISAGHQTFGPAGTLGMICGITATVLFLGNLVYLARKKFRWLQSAGSMRNWLTWHVLSGLLGGGLVGFHAAFEIKTLVARTAVWSLGIVLVTGIVGRYMVRFIPRTRDGHLSDTKLLEDEVLNFIDEIRPAVKGDSEAIAILQRMADAVSGRDEVSGFKSGLEVSRRAKRELKYLRRVVIDGPHLFDVARVSTLMNDATRLYRQLALANLASRLLDSWRIFHGALALLFVVSLIVHIVGAFYYGFASF